MKFPAFATCVFCACLLIGLSACEVYTLSPNNPTGRLHPGYTARSSESAVYLFSAEIQRGNMHAAASMLRPESGLADAHAKYGEISTLHRFSTVIEKKPITEVVVDTISPTHHRLHTYFDYYKLVEFVATKHESTWYITAYSGLTAPSAPNVEILD